MIKFVKIKWISVDCTNLSTSYLFHLCLGLGQGRSLAIQKSLAWPMTANSAYLQGSWNLTFSSFLEWDLTFRQKPCFGLETPQLLPINQNNQIVPFRVAIDNSGPVPKIILVKDHTSITSLDFFLNIKVHIIWEGHKIWEIFTLFLSYVVPVKMKISQNFVAFSEYMNFKR